MSSIFKLYRLQQVDSQLDQMRRRYQTIENELKDDAELQSAERKAERAEAVLQAAKKALRRAEENTRAQRMKIEQSESNLYSGKVTNPKELQDLQNEAESLKRYLSVLEDRQLEAMMSVDEADETFQEAQTRYQRIRSDRELTCAQLIDEQKILERDVERLEQERRATASTIPAEDLAIYEKTREQRGGLGVASVSDRTCTACGSTLSAALMQEARSPHKMTHCNFCGRILYAS